MEGIIVLVLIFFGGWIIRTIFGGVKATVKTATGQGTFSDNFKTEIGGMEDFRFEVKKETKTIENKQSDLFVMNFRGLFPSHLTGRQLSFIFNIFDSTEKDRGPVICPVPGFNEGDSPTFQYIESRIPPFNEGYGWKSWVDTGVAPIEFLKFPHKGNLNLEFQCCITEIGKEPKFSFGGVSEQSDILQVYKYKLNYLNSKAGYSEISEERKKVEKAIIELGFYIAAVDDDLDEKEGKIIKQWAKEQVETSPSSKKDETKKRINEDILGAVKKAKSKDLSISNIIESLNKNAEKNEKYEAIELAMKVLQADGVADEKELRSLDQISKKIGINSDTYKSLRDKGVATIDFRAEKNDEGGELNEKKQLAIFLGLTDINNKEKLHEQLTKLHLNWNARTNVKDKKIKEKAKLMLEKIARAKVLFSDA